MVCPELFLRYNVGERLRQLAEPQTGSFREAASALAREGGRRLSMAIRSWRKAWSIMRRYVSTREGRTIAHHRKLRLRAISIRAVSTGDAYTSFRLRGGSWRSSSATTWSSRRRCAPARARRTTDRCADRTQEGVAFVARAVIPTRAFENGLFLAYANYCGREGAFEVSGREAASSVRRGR